MVIQLTYELKDAERDYSDLYSYIESLGDTMHFLKDAWWIDLPEEKWSDSILRDIKKYLSPDDLFQVVKITDQYTNGWLATSAWEWMKNRNKLMQDNHD